MWQRLFRIETGIFLTIWLVLMTVGRTAMLRDPGSFWHVATGERILASGTVPRVDPFSFTRFGRPWVADQWLPECVMAWIHHVAGWDGLLLAAAALLATIYTWLASRVLQSGLHALPTVLVLAAALLAGAPQFHVRPLILTLGLLGATFALLCDVEAGRRRRRQLWWLVPLFVLWANSHGGVLAGIGTVTLCIVGWCAICPGERLRDMLESLSLLVALGLAMLVNPYGLDLPREWYDTLAMPLPNLIDEHRPLSFTEASGWVTLALAMAYLGTLWGTLPRRPRVTWLLPLVWLLLAIQRVRNVPLFAITVVLALAEMLPYSRVGQWLARHDMLLISSQTALARQSPAPAHCGAWCGMILPWALVAIAFAVQVAGANVPLVGRNWVRWDASRWPTDLLPQLTEIDRSNPEGTRIFNDLNFGGFLIYHTPRLRIFVDDRCSVYGSDFLAAYDHARRADPAQIDRWQPLYDFHYALVESGGPFDRHLAASGQWAIIGRTEAAALFQHRPSKPSQEK